MKVGLHSWAGRCQKNCQALPFESRRRWTSTRSLSTNFTINARGDSQASTQIQSITPIPKIFIPNPSLLTNPTSSSSNPTVHQLQNVIKSPQGAIIPASSNPPVRVFVWVKLNRQQLRRITWQKRRRKIQSLNRTFINRKDKWSLWNRESLWTKAFVNKDKMKRSTFVMKCSMRKIQLFRII